MDENWRRVKVISATGWSGFVAPDCGFDPALSNDEGCDHNKLNRRMLVQVRMQISE